MIYWILLSRSCIARIFHHNFTYVNSIKNDFRFRLFHQALSSNWVIDSFTLWGIMQEWKKSFAFFQYGTTRKLNACWRQQVSNSVDDSIGYDARQNFFLLFTVKPVRGLRNSSECETIVFPWCNFYSRSRMKSQMRLLPSSCCAAFAPGSAYISPTWDQKNERLLVYL